MTFMAALIGGHVRDQRHRAGALHRVRELALVTGAAPRDPPGNDLAALGDDLRHRALLAILAFPVPRLQASLHEDLTAFVEILAARFGLLAPDHDGEEARLLALLSALGAVVAIHGHPEIGDGRAAGCVSEFRGAGQVADQQDLVEARHQPTSSSTSWVFAGRAFFRMGTRVDRKRSTFSLRRSCRSNSLTMAGSAETSKTAYVPSRCLRISYARRR